MKIKPLAERIIQGLAPQTNEHILISGGIHQYPLLSAISVEVAKLGATPHLRVSDDQLHYRMATEIPEEFADRLPDVHDRYCAGLYHAAIAINPIVDETLSSDIPAERRRLGMKAGLILSDIAKASRRRSIYMAWPTETKAQMCNLSVNEFQTLFQQAFLADPDQMMSLGQQLKKSLSQGGNILITSAAGTELKFELNPERRIMIDGGCFTPEMVDVGDITKNLPAGEVYTTPVETSVEGIAVFKEVITEGKLIRDLKLEFEGGKLVNSTAAEGYEYFDRRYSAAVGDRNRLGELGIGINPFLKRPIGHTLLDEKIWGSIHLALGENRMYGGVNQSSIHWDLVMLEPDLSLNGKCILSQGLPQTTD